MVTENTDIIAIIVPGTPQVQEVLFGIDVVSKGLTRGKLVIDISSISPVETKEFSAAKK